MDDKGSETRNESGAGPSESACGPANGGGGRAAFGCCHAMTGDAVGGFPCVSIMRQHPVIVSVIFALMGLFCVVIATGMILGILGFFRAG